MPRQPRTVIQNIPYHITQRGNRGQDVFLTLEHRKQYLKHLRIYSARYHFDILAYCLMSNHIHIVGIPRKPDSMSRTIQLTHSQHTKIINRDTGWQGHLWHSRYFSTALDDAHLWAAIRYVEQNPLRAGLVSRAEDYMWSSASFHCGLCDDPIIYVDKRTSDMFDDWSNTLKHFPDGIITERIRKCTMTGIPCGDDRFVRRMSTKIGKEIQLRRQGRPRKA